MRFQKPACVVHREQLALDQLIQPRARVLAVAHLLRRCFECRDIGFAGAGKFDITHFNENVGNSVDDRLNRPIFFAHAAVFHMPGIEFSTSMACKTSETSSAIRPNIGNSPSKSGACSLMRLRSSCIREPDKILEVRRNKLLRIGDVQFELGPSSGIGVAVTDIGENPGSPRRRAAFLNSSSSTAAPICKPLPRQWPPRESVRACDLDCDQLAAEAGICDSGF